MGWVPNSPSSGGPAGAVPGGRGRGTSGRGGKPPDSRVFPGCLQTLFRRGPQGGGCVVDSEVLTQGIPYQDYFYTVHRYCILSLPRNRARLR